MSTKRSLALLDLKSRLAKITIANVFSSDAGLHIAMGDILQLGPDDAQVGLAVSVGDDTVENRGPRNICTVPVEIAAYVPVDTTDSLIVIEGLIGDIKRAVEIESDQPNSPTGRDIFLGAIVDGVAVGTTMKGVKRGATKQIPREVGATVIGASVTYELTFNEFWGEP